MKYFTVGPTQTFRGFEELLSDALKKEIPSISHRSQEFRELYKSTVHELKRVMNIPEGFSVFFVASANEAMERILQNFSKSSFHYVNGAFSNRFHKIAKNLGIEAKKKEVNFGEGFCEAEKLSTDTICLTHNETSTGVALPLEFIYETKKRNPESIVAVDIVSSAPCYNFDFNNIDIGFFSVQKGFGLPAGLGVIIVRDCIINEPVNDVAFYRNFSFMRQKATEFQTAETPNVLAIYLLGKICKTIDSEIHKKTEEKSKLLYSFFEKTSWKPFVDNYKSNTIIVIETGEDTKNIIDGLKNKGIAVSSGYKDFKEKQIRIANYPMHSKEDIHLLIESMQSLDNKQIHQNI